MANLLRAYLLVVSLHSDGILTPTCTFELLQDFGQASHDTGQLLLRYYERRQ